MLISVGGWDDGQCCSEMSGSSLVSIYTPTEQLHFRFLYVSEIRIPSQCLRGFNLLCMLISRPGLVTNDSQGLFTISLGMGGIWS